MHIAIGHRRRPLCKPIGNGHVARAIRIAGFGGQQAADGTNRTFFQSKLGGGFIDNGPIGKALMDLGHKFLPQGRRIAAAGGLALEFILAIIIVADPDGGAIVRGDTGEAHAGIIGVGTGLSGHGHAADLGLGAGAPLHRVGQDIHQHIGGGFLEDLMPLPHAFRVQNHLPVIVHHPHKGQGLNIFAAVANGAKGCCHFHRGDICGTQRQAAACGADPALIHPKIGQIFRPLGDGYILQQGPGRRHVQGLDHAGPQRQGA